MLKQVFLACFEPVLTEISPFHHMYAPLCALRTYLRAVWWSHLELGEGCRLEDIYIYIYIYSPQGLVGVAAGLGSGPSQAQVQYGHQCGRNNGRCGVNYMWGLGLPLDYFTSD